MIIPISPTSWRNFSRAISSRTRITVIEKLFSAGYEKRYSFDVLTLICTKLNVIVSERMSASARPCFHRHTYPDPNRNCSYLTVSESHPWKNTGFNPSTTPSSLGKVSIAYGQNVVINSTTECAQDTIPP